MSEMVLSRSPQNLVCHASRKPASRRYSKCAGVVGEVLKKNISLRDSAVYDALVRMAAMEYACPIIDVGKF